MKEGNSRQVAFSYKGESSSWLYVSAIKGESSCRVAGESKKCLDKTSGRKVRIMNAQHVISKLSDKNGNRMDNCSWPAKWMLNLGRKGDRFLMISFLVTKWTPFDWNIWNS